MTPLLGMSLRGAAVIAAVILLRALLLDRLPKRTFLALWAVAMLTLLLPWTLQAPTSVWGLLRPAVEAAEALPGASLGEAEQGTAPGAPYAPRRVAPVRLLPWIYRAGAGLVLGFFLGAWVRFRHRLRRSVPVDNALTRDYIASAGLRRRVRVREAEAIASPLTCGILRPVILFLRPTVWARSEALELIFAHELQHIRRFDALKKGLLILTVAIHWFNPLVWAMFLLANRDIELACDEAVLRRLGRDKRRIYALTLLAMEEKRSGLSALMSGMAQNAVEQRIRSVMNMKQRSILTILLALALVVGIYAVFATSAPAKAPETVEKTETILLPVTEAPTQQGRTEPFATAWRTEAHESASSGDGIGWGESRSACASFGLNEGAAVTLALEGGGAQWLQATLVDYRTGKIVAQTEQVAVSGDFCETLTLTAPYTDYFTVILQASIGNRYWVKSRCTAEAAVDALPPMHTDSTTSAVGGASQRSVTASIHCALRVPLLT